MIFANIEYLFLLILLIPYIIWYVMKRKKTEPTLQVSTTRMYMEGTQKLEDLLAACSVRTPYGGYHHGNPDLGTPSDHRQLAEYRNKKESTSC